MTFGMSAPLIALLLDRSGFTSTVVGLNSAAASLAVLLIGPIVPRLLERIGVLPAMYLSIAGCAVILLLIPAWRGIEPWFILRFLLGAFGGLHWIVSETWIVAVAHESLRGRTLGLYVSVVSLGFAIGPIIINLIGPTGFAPFVVAATLISVSGVPLLLARGRVPKTSERPRRAIRTAVRKVPFILAAAALAGITDTTLLSLLHVYGLHEGMPQDSAVFMLTVTFVGTVAFQFPIGWLADRLNRKLLLKFLIALFIAIPALIPLAFPSQAVLWPLLLLWGGASMGVYTVSLSILGNAFEPAALPGANAAFVMVYEAGSLAGPVWCGASMDLFGPPGLLWALALPAAAFFLIPLRHWAAGTNIRSHTPHTDGNGRT